MNYKIHKHIGMVYENVFAASIPLSMLSTLFQSSVLISGVFSGHVAYMVLFFSLCAFASAMIVKWKIENDYENSAEKLKFLLFLQYFYCPLLYFVDKLALQYASVGYILPTPKNKNRHLMRVMTGAVKTRNGVVQ